MQLWTVNKVWRDSAEKDLFATRSLAKPLKKSQIVRHHCRAKQTRCVANAAHMQGSAPASTGVLTQPSDVLGCWVTSHHILHMCSSMVKQGFEHPGSLPGSSDQILAGHYGAS